MNQKGIILNEAIIAIGIITISILGMMGILSRAISDTRYIQDQAKAIKLAGEGIEIARNILDGNAVRSTAMGRPIPWNEGFNQEGFYEIDYTSTMLGAPLHSGLRNNLRNLRQSVINGTYFYSYTGTSPTGFKRSVEIRYIHNDQIRVTSRVYWTPKVGRLDYVRLSSDFYNWR